MFLTEDEEYVESSDTLKDEDYILANDVVFEAESDDYQCSYINSLSTQQREYPWRRKYVPISPIQKRKDAKSKNDLSNDQKK